MGLWDATCQITRTPILSGEECVAVSLNPEVLRVNAAPNGRRIGPFILTNNELIFRIIRGSYDRSGWIDEDENPKQMYEDVRIFFAANAWDRICRFISSEGNQDDLVGQFSKIGSFLELTRRDALCEIFHGQQIRGKTQVDAYHLVADITSESVKRFRELAEELADE